MLRASHTGQRLQGIARPSAAVGTHMCVAEYTNAELHRGSRFTQVWPTKCTQGSYTCVLQNVSIQGCTQESRVTTEGRPVAAASIHMCVCCRIYQSRVAPEDQGLQGFDRPIAARAHTHTARVAEYANSGLHPRIKGYEGLADDVLLRAYTRLLQNKPIQGCNQGLHGFVRPTASVSTRMRVAENINSGPHLGPKGQG